jgi:phage terminase Nu1 subunit (DNA packaging protein)
VSRKQRFVFVGVFVVGVMPDGATLSAGEVLLSKRELSAELDCSLPTLDRLIDRFNLQPATPGGPGKPYKFRLADVQRVLGEARSAAEQEAAQRAELLSGLSLGTFGPAGDTEADGMTPQARHALAKAVAAERNLAKDAGELLAAAGVRAALTKALTIMGRGLDQLPARVGRRFNLPDSVVHEMRQEINGQRAQLVREIQAALTDGEPGDEEQGGLPV